MSPEGLEQCPMQRFDSPRRLLLYVQLRGRLDPPRAATKTGGFRSQAEGEPTRGSLRRYRSLLGVSG